MGKPERNPRETDRLARKWAKVITEVVKNLDSKSPPKSFDRKQWKEYRGEIDKLDRIIGEGLASGYDVTLFLGTEESTTPQIPVFLELHSGGMFTGGWKRIETSGGAFSPIDEAGFGAVKVKMRIPRPEVRAERGRRDIEEIHESVREILKHEFEHAFQFSRKFAVRELHPKYMKRRPAPVSTSLRREKFLNYMLSRGEIEAYVAGIHLSAKKAREPFHQRAWKELNRVTRGQGLTEDETSLIWQAWIDEVKKRYPKAIVNTMKKKTKGRKKENPQTRSNPGRRRMGMSLRDVDQDLHDKQRERESQKAWERYFEEGNLDPGPEPRIKGRTVKKTIEELKRELKANGFSLSGTQILPYSRYRGGFEDRPWSPITIFSKGEIGRFLDIHEEPVDPIVKSRKSALRKIFSDFGLEPALASETEIGLVTKSDRERKVWKDFLSAFVRAEEYWAGKLNDEERAIYLEQLESNPGKKERRSIPKAQLDTSHWDAYSLIKTCQELWESYCERPSKKRIKAVLDHLETMKASKSAKVKSERQRCLRAARAEAREFGMKI